ncbi:MAG: hypothetical protein ABW199_04450 [Caulobacterales bacterium]
MTLVRWLIAIGVCTLAVSCASRPKQDEQRPMEMPRVLLSSDALVFATMDSNNDLRTDATERAAGIAAEWVRADTDRDGALTPIEMQNWLSVSLGGSNAPPYRLDFDRNVNNRVTRAEFEQELNARASDYDKDNDGFLTRSEFLRDAPRMQMREPRGDMARRGPPPR